MNIDLVHNKVSPKLLHVREGESATFRCHSRTEPLWIHNEELLEPHVLIEYVGNYLTLFIANVSCSDHGKYECLGEEPYRRYFSDQAWLIVNSKMFLVLFII